MTHGGEVKSDFDPRNNSYKITWTVEITPEMREAILENWILENWGELKKELGVAKDEDLIPVIQEHFGEGPKTARQVFLGPIF